MNELDLSDVAIFVRVVEAGSFTAAAQAMHVPKSSVSRRVARLEARLGTRLLQRTTRSLSLTDAGRTYYTRVAAAIAELGDAATTITDTQAEPHGRIRLTAPADVGAEVLPRLVTSFLRRYPKISVDVDLTPTVPDLVEGAYDLALRAGTPGDDSPAVTVVQAMPFRLYAAPAYLAEAGTPQHPEDLTGHRCVLFRAHNGRTRWRLHTDDTTTDVSVTGPVTANDMTFVRRAAIAAAGIALLPELVGANAVLAKTLHPVLPTHHAPGTPLFLVQASTRHVPLAVRLLRDHLLSQFPTSHPANSPNRSAAAASVGAV